MMKNAKGRGRHVATTRRLSRGQRAADLKDHLLVELELRETRLQLQIQSLEKLQRDLENSRRRFQTLYQNAPIGYLTLTEAGLIQDWNATAAALLDASQHGLADLPLTFFTERKDVRIFFNHLARCKRVDKGQVISEFHLKGRKQQSIPIQLVSIPFREGGKKLLHSALIDLTELQKSRTALEQAKDFSDGIIQIVHKPLAVLDEHLKIVRINEAFARLFGLQQQLTEGLLFESALRLWWAGNALRKRLESTLFSNAPLINFEFTVEPDRAERRILLFNARRIQAKESSPPLLLVAIEDITARKKAEEDLAESNRQLHDLNHKLEERVVERTKELSESNKQLESFCYSIAHDLRAPLRAMAGFGSALEDEFRSELGERGKDFLDRIITAGETMDRLIRDLLEYGRFNTVDLSTAPVDADEVLNRVIRNLQADIQHTNAQILCKQKLPKLLGNPVALEAAFSNLLSNALKFVPAKTKPEVNIWPEDDKGRVRICIADNGIGIDPQYQKKIFQVFQRLHSQTDYPGTGIGLAIVNRAIQRIGGSVGVDSEAGKGSRFWITLPRAQ